jgi:hypothetical protein
MWESIFLIELWLVQLLIAFYSGMKFQQWAIKKQLKKKITS